MVDWSFEPSRRRTTLFRLVLLIGFVLIAMVFALELAEKSRKVQLAFILASSAALFGIWIRDVTSILLAAALLAISYNRHYYSFDGIFGDFGHAGLYWVPADALFFLIALCAAWQALVRRDKIPSTAPPDGVETGLLLFIGALFIAALGADRFLPAFFEVVRFLKMLLIFLLLRHLMDARGRMAVLLGLGFLVTVQFSISTLQFVLGAGESGLSNLQAASGEMAHRATGTLGHPAFLSPWFLTFAPGLLAAGSLGLRGGARWLVAGLGVLAVITMVMTQTRAPLAALMIALFGLSTMLLSRRLLTTTRLSGIVILGLAGMVILATPVADRIHARLTGDFGESLSFRGEYNTAALEMWAQSPLTGVGPNHFVPELEEFAPRLFAINEELGTYRLEANARSAAPVHNTFLLVLSETGIIGLIAFGLFLFSMFRLYWEVARRSPGQFDGLFCLGIFWGMFGLMFEQMTDFSMWWDHHMALFVVLAAYASGVRRDQLAQSAGAANPPNPPARKVGHDNRRHSYI